jgi:signal transduction histidine kinase
VPDEARKAYRRCIELKNRLISFLTLYKHEHAQLKLHIVEADLTEFLEDMIATSQSAALGGSHGNSVDVVLDEDKIKISPGVKHKGVAAFDQYLVDIALESALNNAVRYAVGKVSVWFEQDAQCLTFFVLDDGPGLNAPETGKTGKSTSTGLGLSLCNAVTETHGGGKVTLADAPGGALFSMELHLAG